MIIIQVKSLFSISYIYSRNINEDIKQHWKVKHADPCPAEPRFILFFKNIEDLDHDPHCLSLLQVLQDKNWGEVQYKNYLA